MWKGNAASGTLSGTISGSTLSGTLVNNEAGQSASFSIVLAPDGHSFSGTFTIVGGSTGQWRSACGGGACLSNAAPPAPPVAPLLPPPTSPKVLAAAAAWGQAGPAAVLGPGEQAIAISPPISAKQREVSVAVSDGTLAANVVLNIAVGIAPEPEKKLLTRGNCVRAAVGAARKIRESAEGDGIVNPFIPPPPPPDTSVDEFLAFTTFLAACLDHVKELEEQARKAGLPPVSAAARASCQLRFRAMKVRVNKTARTISYRMRRASRKEPVRLLRSSCRKARNGTVTLRIRTASRGVKLRKLVGSRLEVGLHRSATATGTANVRTTFKRR